MHPTVAPWTVSAMFTTAGELLTQISDPAMYELSISTGSWLFTMLTEPPILIASQRVGSVGHIAHSPMETSRPLRGPPCTDTEPPILLGHRMLEYWLDPPVMPHGAVPIETATPGWFRSTAPPIVVPLSMFTYA